MITKEILISEFEKIHSALQNEKYVINNTYNNGHHVLIKDSNCSKNDIFSDSPLKMGNIIWLGHSLKEFKERSVNLAFEKVDYFKNGLSLRSYPTETVGYITVDDISDSRKYKLAKKYTYALKIETSPRNYQGVLKIHLPNQNRENELFALRETAQILNYGFGDPEVRSPAQIFRFSETYNNKEKHKNEAYPHGYIVKLKKYENVFCPKAQKLFDSVLALIEKGNYKKFLSKHKKNKTVEKVKNDKIIVKKEVKSIEKRDFSLLFEKNVKPEILYFTYALPLVNKKGYQSEKLDRMVAIHLKQQGYNKEQIQAIIQFCCYKFNADIRGKLNGKSSEYKSRNTFSFNALEHAQKTAHDAFNHRDLLDMVKTVTPKFLAELKKSENYWHNKFKEEISAQASPTP